MGRLEFIWKVILILWFLNIFIICNGKEHEENVMEKSKPETKLANYGVSRFDVTGILTAFGMKQGASIFALVLFPILFPLMILLGVALFIISLFGAGGVTAIGRRSDLLSKMNGDSFGYTSLLGGEGGTGYYDNSMTNVIESDACLEKLVCELLVNYGGSRIVGKKTTFEILRDLNVKPYLVPSTSFSGRKSRKVWNCSSLKCNWDG